MTSQRYRKFFPDRLNLILNIKIQFFISPIFLIVIPHNTLIVGDCSFNFFKERLFINSLIIKYWYLGV